jgi:hypothetical protein
MTKNLANNDTITASVQQSVKSLVDDLNLRPFAKRDLVKNRVRFTVTDANNETALLLALLNSQPSIETTLLIHPEVLPDFYDYNQFLGRADDLLQQIKLQGVYQIASFHPDYQFGGAAPDDAENYSNRSPYPLLHLLREESLARAIDDFADVEQIPVRNIELMNKLGSQQLRALLHACSSERR